MWARRRQQLGLRVRVLLGVVASTIASALWVRRSWRAAGCEAADAPRRSKSIAACSASLLRPPLRLRRIPLTPLGHPPPAEIRRILRSHRKFDVGNFLGKPTWLVVNRERIRAVFPYYTPRGGPDAGFINVHSVSLYFFFDFNLWLRNFGRLLSYKYISRI